MPTPSSGRPHAARLEARSEEMTGQRESAGAPRPRTRLVKAALGSLPFLLVAPGIGAGLIPAWITSWQMRSAPLPLRAAGVIMIVAGAGVLLHAFVRFVVEGIGTPA